MMQLQAYGDKAMLINFEQKIDPDINEAVIALSQQIESSKLPGVEYLIPAYCSLTIGFNPAKTDFHTLKETIQNIEKAGPLQRKAEPALLKIPVCYKEAFSPDIEEVSRQTNLSKETIVNLHTSHKFRVYMLGFLPGFVYLGSLPSQLSCKRKDHPRIRVPARSVGLAGTQTGIYPSEAPGGWQIIGRTPIPVFDPHSEDSFLFKAGDWVQFYEISSTTFSEMEKEIADGHFNKSRLYE